MSNIKLMTKEEAQKFIDSKKSEENQYGMFFNLISDLPKEFKKSLEDQLVNMVIMGNAMGGALRGAKPGSSEYNDIANRLVTISQKTKSQVEEDLKRSQENAKQREKDAK